MILSCKSLLHGFFIFKLCHAVYCNLSGFALMPGNRLNNIRVLVVDDTIDNLLLTERLLSTQGAVVKTAPSAARARILVDSHDFDIILLDIRMPEVDGFTFMRELRQNPRTAHLPMVAVTAFAMMGDRHRVLESGFDAYVPKPIDAVSMLDQIAELVGAPPDEDPY
jgi:CheY-like chemotaxis protein